ncbi:MAG: methyltransferase domain-containing protein [Myxococcota bacterium]|jgi:SAM-dependent methyltransferase/uncharacterized protein YbaR (Trm112 family)|nr:methyltransferase domain-containing protein [Myxococcota bacterium]
MRERTLSLLCCPDCQHHPLTVQEASTVAGEIEAGTLVCPACGAAFPVVLGIPRLLPQPLLAGLLEEFGLLDRFPRARAAQVEPEGEFASSVRRTMVGYTLEHLLLQDLEVDWAAHERYFAEHTLVPSAELAGLRVLDVGCGDGRWVGCAGPLAGETIGFDLSRGVELARRRTRGRGTVDFVQGDVFHLPFVEESFDLVSSVGVLHHTPDPRQAYLAAAKRVRPGGGRFNLWVYGLQGMRLEYRLSHLVPLRRAIQGLDLDARLQLSFWLTSLLDLSLWAPARAVARLGVPGLPALIRLLPVIASHDRPFLSRLRGVFDRIQPPEASYHTREELGEWMAAAGLIPEVLRTKEGRGWIALGRRP